MKDSILSFLENCWLLLESIAPYILVGIFLAALMKLFLKDEWIKRQIGGKDIKSLLKAILLGIPLPLCSCSVIPFATALRKSGASKASTMGFLIATPITGLDSIVATYGVFGWFFTLYRVITSVLIAILAGILSLLFDREDSKSEKSEPLKPKVSASAVSSFAPTQASSSLASSTVFTQSLKPKQSKEDSCGLGSCCGSDSVQTKESFIVRLWNEAVYKIFGDFAKALLVGILLGALLLSFMPAQLASTLSETLWLNYLLVLLIAAPLYICATSSIPLGVALLGAGFSPGAVFLFLTAGPATSTVTMSIVYKILGRRSLILYLIAVTFGTLILAWLFDTLFATQSSAIIDYALHKERQASFIDNVLAFILLILAWKVIVPKPKSGGCCGG